MNDTPTIRARIHESAIKRVTRMFAATLADAFTEILQNARRAGARRVHVAVAGSEGNTAVTVTDDGAGIADAGVLLSFAENGWSEDLVRGEDAAGMGMLSLARRGCTVSSRPRTTDGEPAPGWRVDLAPEHFLGEAEAEVRTDDAAPYPHGTAVTFRTTENAEAIRAGVGTAAWHYPLPVVFEHAPDTPAGGEQIERRAFLDGALHAERWRGLVFGVFKDRWAGFGLNDPDVNFHGLTVSVRLPSVETVTGARWSVAADIVDCPELELVLPARKEAVETPFLAEMREAARLAIYRAVAADPDPRPAFEDWKRARDAGIDIAAPPAELRPWRPVIADVDDWQEPPKLHPVGADSLRMEYEPESPEAQTFWRAARGNAVAERLFETDRRLEGYGWYDAIARIVNLHTQVTLKGEDLRTRCLPRAGTHRRAGSAASATAGRDPRQPRRPPDGRTETHPRPRDRSRLRGRGVVLGARRAAAGSPRTASWSPGSSPSSSVRDSSLLRMTLTQIRGSASARTSSRKRFTWPRGFSVPTTRRVSPRSPMPSRASSSGSSPTTGARRFRCATARSP